MKEIRFGEKESNIKNVKIVIFSIFLLATLLSNFTCSANVDNELIKATLDGDVTKVRILLSKGASADATDRDGVTALMWASEKGHFGIVELLLSKNADVNAREDNYGMTALMTASAEGHLSIVKALLNKGADVNLKDYNLGATALLGAGEYGYTDIVGALISKGADINAKTKENRTALMVAATNGHTTTVQAILEAGADVNIKDLEFGATALMGASANGHGAIVQALLEKGANLDEKSNNGMAALDWAKTKGQKKVIQILEKAMSEY